MHLKVLFFKINYLLPSFSVDSRLYVAPSVYVIILHMSSKDM